MPNYAPLHTFLVGRLADRVVLTFAQMEDLLGCPLPADARTDPAWWAVPPGTTATEQSGFWTGADRTATANLLALTSFLNATRFRQDASVACSATA